MIDEENPRDHGIYLLGNNNNVSNNYAAYNARNGIRSEGENNLINSNVLENNGESGIAVWVDNPLEGRHFTISKNLIINNPKDGIAINGGGSGEKPFDLKIHNNTIVSEFSQAGLRIINGSRYVKIKNNIIMGNFSQAFLGTDNKSIEGYEEDHNIFYGTGAFYYNGIHYENLISYKSKSSWGTNSIFENPNLKSDYSLSSNSIAKENGTDVGLSFEGEKPSIGAFEFGEDGVINASVPSIMLKRSNTDVQ